MTPYLILAGIVGIGVILWMARKAGGDEVRANTAEADLAKAKTAAAPVSDAERADVIKLYSRD